MVNDPKNISPDADLLGKYFAGEATPEEAMQVDEWRQLNTAEFDHFALIWQASASGIVYRAPDPASAWIRWTNRRTKVKRMTNAWRIAAACLLIPAGILIYKKFHPVIPVAQTTVMLTTRATADTLSDKTIVMLKTGSALSYPKSFAGEERKVQLQGEGYFSVMHDSARPFVVQAGELSLVDIGTRFNIRIDSTYITAQVTDGGVQMTGTHDSLRVHAGQTGIYDRQRKVFRLTYTIQKNDFAYATQTLYFYDSRLPEVSHTLGLYYHVKILFQDSTATGCKLTTEFVHQPLKNVLDIIASSFDMQYIIHQDTVRFSGHGCK